MDTDWKVNIADALSNAEVQVTFWRTANQNEIEVLHFREDGTASIKTYPEHSPVEPTLRLGWRFRSLLSSLVGALEGEGIRGPARESIEGELKAQTKHLADLRHFLKLPATQEKKEGK